MMHHVTASPPRILLGMPVYNEEKYIARVLGEVRKHFPAPCVTAKLARNRKRPTEDHAGVQDSTLGTRNSELRTSFCATGTILVIDDGSTDSTPMLLAQQPVEVIRHAENRGYGRSMQDMIRWASFDGFDWLITMDCDEQHEPAAIPRFIDRIIADEADVISGSRYLQSTPLDDAPPQDRRAINTTITAELNQRLNLNITDAFCGFKAYRVSACEELALDVDGYEFPMQFWVQAVAHTLRIEELPVRLIYNDPSRSFGGPLDDPTSRLEHYRATMEREIARCAERLPESATKPAKCGA